MVPVHATVTRLLRSIVPQLTSTAGSGYIMVPGFQFCFIRYSIQSISASSLFTVCPQ